MLNNPLSGTDPSGYLTFRQVVGIAIAVVAAAYGQYYFAKDALALSFGISVAGGFTASYVATGSVEAGVWGAFAAGVFWGIGTAFSTGYCDLSSAGAGATATTGSVTARVAAHAAAGGTLNLMQGGKFGHGFASAGITQALSPVIGRAGGNGPKGIVTRAALSAALGGTVSKITGGKFANGAATSAFQSLFNQAVHDATSEDLRLTADEESRLISLRGAFPDASSPTEAQMRILDSGAVTDVTTRGCNSYSCLFTRSEVSESREPLNKPLTLRY